MNDVAQVLAPRGSASPTCRRAWIETWFADPSKLLSFWHLASLDAPTVALVWSAAFAWTAGIQLPLWMLVLIVLTVWVVYVVDRVLDVRSALRDDCFDRLRERHFFHWHHRPILMPLAAIAAIAAAWVVFNVVPRGEREPGSMLAAAFLLYFAGVHAGRKVIRVLPNEFLVGVLFTAGCALAAWSRAGFWQHHESWPQILVAGYFACLAWLNCHAISCWESGAGASNSRSSFKPALLTAAAGIPLFASLLPVDPRCAALLLSGTGSALLLAWLDQHRSRASSLALRTAADMVLLTPLLIVPIAPLFRR